jgi:hypothetical protein
MAVYKPNDPLGLAVLGRTASPQYNVKAALRQPMQGLPVLPVPKRYSLELCSVV